METKVKLTWGSHIRYSPGAKSEAISIRRNIRRRQPGSSIYIIVMPEDGVKPEMYRDTMLFSMPFADKSYKIIGIARGREEAVELFAEMIETVYKKDPALDYAKYYAAHS
jgi:hypothetical protein